MKLQRLENDKVSKSTVDKNVAVAKSFFNWCIHQGLTSANPVKKVKLFHEDTNGSDSTIPRRSIRCSWQRPARGHGIWRYGPQGPAPAGDLPRRDEQRPGRVRRRRIFGRHQQECSPEVEMKTITVPQMAQDLGVGKPRVRQMLRDGTIPAVRVGARYIVSRMAFERWLANLGMGRPIPQSEAVLQ
jgi:excisionase family DNA binding protein